VIERARIAMYVNTVRPDVGSASDVIACRAHRMVVLSSQPLLHAKRYNERQLGESEAVCFEKKNG
jgi:hypothetical protein